MWGIHAALDMVSALKVLEIERGTQTSKQAITILCDKGGGGGYTAGRVLNLALRRDSYLEEV